MSDITNLPGVGDKIAGLLRRLNIRTIDDLIENVPRRYIDYSEIVSIANIKPGTVTLKVKIHSVHRRYSKKGLHLTEAIASDTTGSVKVVWFNQPYRAASLKLDEEYYLSGEYAQSYKYLAITNPTLELASSFPIHTARLVPVYRLTKGVSVHTLRKLTKKAFDSVEVLETLPRWLIDKMTLMGRQEALLNMHFPQAEEQMLEARRRLAFEELFEMSLASSLNKEDFKNEKAQNVPVHQKKVVTFVESLPFKLTDDQRKAAWSILQDMTTGSPMNRMLQGDVGSGKTIVAAIAMFNVACNRQQAVLMAPTEILATQHMKTLLTILPNEVRDKIVFLKGSMTKKDKDQAIAAISSGEAVIIVGTHALIQQHVNFDNLVLAVIDEQHRFGVEQRKLLQGKAQSMPHVLNMTATPIPRSLMLTLYGEMDTSIIREKPQNRMPVRTSIHIPETREKVYSSLGDQLLAGRQMFVVCPLIEQEEQNVKRSLSVEHIHKQIAGWMKGFRVEMLHGKMKSTEKDAIMQSFVSGDIQILVSTTVIEVGVDVPNASVMVIEGADKFGLAQIHQLRGRIGRGMHEGFCYLFPSDNDAISDRLKSITNETDGFKLAELDLELRGPGAIYGTVQHGALDLRVAKITDTALIAIARSAATEFIDRNENLLEYKQLATRVNRLRTITNLN